MFHFQSFSHAHNHPSDIRNSLDASFNIAQGNWTLLFSFTIQQIFTHFSWFSYNAEQANLITKSLNNWFCHANNILVWTCLMLSQLNEYYWKVPKKITNFILQHSHNSENQPIWKSRRPRSTSALNWTTEVQHCYISFCRPVCDHGQLSLAYAWDWVDIPERAIHIAKSNEHTPHSSYTRTIFPWPRHFSRCYHFYFAYHSCSWFTSKIR